jgi:DUF971 family protein
VIPAPITVTAIKRRRAENLLDVTFGDGAFHSLSAEYLRVESPSAEVQGHHAAERQLVPGKSGVCINNIERVGNYAVRLIFSDGHDTGIYSWDVLHRLGREYEHRWAAYLKRLKEAGLSR